MKEKEKVKEEIEGKDSEIQQLSLQQVDLLFNSMMKIKSLSI